MKFFYKKTAGFTLIEIMVVIGIIGILSAIIFASFSDARQISRDKVRTTTLKEMQLAIEFYKAQNDVYPAAGCSTPNTNFAGPGEPGDTEYSKCSDYISGLVPDFMPSLPTDPVFEQEAGRGFFYRSDGNSYKLMAYDVVENLTITNYGAEFARCPVAGGVCLVVPPPTTYAVYSYGAESW